MYLTFLLKQKNNWLLACIMYFYLFYFCLLLILVRIDATNTHPTLWIVRFTTVTLFAFPTLLTHIHSPLNNYFSKLLWFCLSIVNTLFKSAFPLFERYFFNIFLSSFDVKNFVAHNYFLLFKLDSLCTTYE